MEESKKIIEEIYKKVDVIIWCLLYDVCHDHCGCPWYNFTCKCGGYSILEDLNEKIISDKNLIEFHKKIDYICNIRKDLKKLEDVMVEKLNDFKKNLEEFK